MMFDGDGDGVYQFTTDDLPTGAYEVKVAHEPELGRELRRRRRCRRREQSRSAPSDGKVVAFRYTLATHVLTVKASRSAARGHRRAARALDRRRDDRVAGRPRARAAADASWQLYASAAASRSRWSTASHRRRRDRPHARRGRSDRRSRRSASPRSPASPRCTSRVRTGMPWPSCCRGSSWWPQRDADGALSAFTGVQIPGVLDDLYAGATSTGDDLGVTFQGKKPTFRLWAPTAQQRDAPHVGCAGADGDPVRHEATWDAASGVWTVKGGKALKGDEYLWEVAVYAPTTGRSRRTRVTDPYSVALTTNSERSVAIDLDDKEWRPKQWEKTKAPVIDRPVDRAIYELHIRDFSITRRDGPRGRARHLPRLHARQRRARRSCASSPEPASTRCTCCPRSTSRRSRRTAPPRRARLRPRVVRPGRRPSSRRASRRSPTPTASTGATTRTTTRRPRARTPSIPRAARASRVPRDGRRAARHGPAGRARRGLQPHRAVGSG